MNVDPQTTPFERCNTVDRVDDRGGGLRQNPMQSDVMERKRGGIS
jgi:hypothetical protein